MESMIDAGVHFGFPRAVATKLVQQTVKGTAVHAMSPEVGQADANFAQPWLRARALILTLTRTP